MSRQKTERSNDTKGPFQYFHQEASETALFAFMYRMGTVPVRQKVAPERSLYLLVALHSFASRL